MENFGDYIREKCLDFAVDIMNMNKHLCEDKKKSMCCRSDCFEVERVLEPILSKHKTESVTKILLQRFTYL